MQRMFAVFTMAIVAAAALGVFVLSGTASAEGTTISGKGVLYARGSGTAEISGDGRVEIRSFGSGTVTITGAETIEARGDGNRLEMPDGSVKFTGWNGYIRAAGEDMTVSMAGSKIQFRAAGEGTATLKGHGSFRIGHHSGRWTEGGITIEFTS